MLLPHTPQGLVMMEDGPSGRLVSLANRVSPSSTLDPGSQITFADDLDIASDGTIYFTDAQNITTAPNRQVAGQGSGMQIDPHSSRAQYVWSPVCPDHWGLQ